MSETRTRTVESVGDPGKWQAQYFDETMRLWFDIGDATLTYEEAKAKQQVYDQEQVSTEEPVTDAAGYLSCGCHSSQPDHTCKS